jgi:tRNA nucleotidyltransferase (CCA-adding enzyme)
MADALDRLLSAIPADVLGICQRLRDDGKRGWVVGGCVRDLLRGQPAKDWDVATDARPEEVQRLFRKVIPTGIEHGTVTVLIKGTPYELTTLRGEGAYADGRHPSEVVFLDDIVEDLARRDFTVNAIAIDPVDGKLIDPFGGQRDLEQRIMRAVGEPLQRFTEDGLRILRGARFAATLGCTIEADTLAAMGDARALDTFRRVSAERVHDEWMKAMLAERPSVAFDVMRSTGILEVHCAELLEGVGCEQNRWHAYDVWQHTMAVLDSCHPDPVLRIAALMHDVAKPRTRAMSEKTNDYTFYNHEQVGAEMTDDILRRLRFSNEHRKRVVHLVRHHLICYSSEWSDAAVRR